MLNRTSRLAGWLGKACVCTAEQGWAPHISVKIPTLFAFCPFARLPVSYRSTSELAALKVNGAAGQSDQTNAALGCLVDSSPSPNCNYTAGRSTLNGLGSSKREDMEK